ncbi:hypothetical protein TIFTF001_009793 [Ficus carica]|uniref:DUF1985 domain-containing protein n=1 Tax=Ficus carica TaxID=3494 RepID=A0AA87ZVN2_FICCA|nr:hypothetical protein TIFTF001_009793 [Ficus carica]
MSESCLPSLPPLMLSLASSLQPNTSPLPSPPPGFGENVGQESIENIEDSREDEGDEVDTKETNGSTENSSNEEVDKEDHDISRMVLTSELQELPPLILSEYFSAKVIVRSKMTILEDIQKWLTEEDKTVFRSYPQLGPLIDLPIVGEFFDALAHNLLLRKTVCQIDHEVWFLIEGKPLRFSLNEFVLISGLYTSSGPSKDEIKAQEKKN